MKLIFENTVACIFHIFAADLVVFLSILTGKSTFSSARGSALVCSLKRPKGLHAGFPSIFILLT